MHNRAFPTCQASHGLVPSSVSVVSECWKGTLEEYTLHLFGHKDNRQHSNSHCGVAIRFKDPEASFKSGRVTASLLADKVQ